MKKRKEEAGKSYKKWGINKERRNKKWWPRNNVSDQTALLPTYVTLSKNAYNSIYKYSIQLFRFSVFFTWEISKVICVDAAEVGNDVGNRNFEGLKNGRKLRGKE